MTAINWANLLKLIINQRSDFCYGRLTTTLIFTIQNKRGKST